MDGPEAAGEPGPGTPDLAPSPTSGWVLPSAPVEVVPGLTYGGIGRRVVAWFLDGLVISIAIVVITVTLGAVIGNDRVRSIVLGLSFGVISYSYYVWSWTRFRATPAMRLMALQIGAVDGTNLSMNRAAIRWFILGDPINVVAYLLPTALGATTGLGLLLSVVLLVSAVSNPMRQGLHDRAAGSLVVQPSSAGNLGWVLAIVVIVGALVLISIVALIFLGGQVSRILSDVGRSI